MEDYLCRHRQWQLLVYLFRVCFPSSSLSLSLSLSEFLSLARSKETFGSKIDYDTT